MHETPLSIKTRAIILGSLLGDGSLKLHKPYINARFSFRHSDVQKKYFDWKVNQLKEISSDKNVWQQGKNGKDGWGGVKWRYQSKALPVLTELFNLTHPHGTFRIRRKWLNQLTPLSLAIWWQDDGSIIANGRKGVLCTDGFEKDQVELLARYIGVVWEVKTTAAPKNARDPNHYRLWFRSTKELQSFLRIIFPHIAVEEMLPKFLLLYRNPQLQQRWISEVVKLSGFPLETVERYYRLKQKKWKQYRGNENPSENDIVQSL